MFKLKYVSIVLLLLCGFVLGIAVSASAQVQVEQTIEARMASVEQQLQDLRNQVNSDSIRQNYFNEQVKGKLGGRYIAQLYSEAGYSTYFLGNPAEDDSGGTTSYMARLEDAVVVLSVNNEEVGSVDLSNVIQPGDMLIAWRGFEPEEWFGVPLSPDIWNVPAYYWNSINGLAVAIIHADGSSEGGVVLVK